MNTLGKRSDGFHNLETILFPVPLFDALSFELADGEGTHLACSDASLPLDHTNLVLKAARAFRDATGIDKPVRIHLEKKIPMAAGLGGGSSNAAHTLAGMNELFHRPLTDADLSPIAAQIGSDVPFFLQDAPALGTGRGEIIHPLDPVPSFSPWVILLIRPGFGIATSWAYRKMSDFPEAQQGVPGQAERLAECLCRPDPQLADIGALVYNALERPAFFKYPFLPLLKRFLLDSGAPVALMSGSGSTLFAIFPDAAGAESAASRVVEEFGETTWTAVIPLR